MPAIIRCGSKYQGEALGSGLGSGWILKCDPTTQGDFLKAFRIRQYLPGSVMCVAFKGEQGSKSILDPCLYRENTSHF